MLDTLNRFRWFCDFRATSKPVRRSSKAGWTEEEVSSIVMDAPFCHGLAHVPSCGGLRFFLIIIVENEI